MTEKRITVAIDASPASIAACRLAAELAAEIRAELLGLFVEDLDLLQSAGLPVTREVTLQTGEVRSIDPAGIERQLRGQARRARAALEKIARRARVRCSFQTTRGRVGSTLSRHANESDWLLVGRRGWSLSGRRHVGSAVRALLSDGPRRLLVLQQNLQRPGPVRILIHSDTPLKEVLEAARPLMGDDSPVEFWLTASDDETLEALKKKARSLVESHRTPMFRSTGPENGNRLAREVTDRGVIVLHAAHPFFDESRKLTDLLGKVRCPVLIVR